MPESAYSKVIQFIQRKTIPKTVMLIQSNQLRQVYIYIYIYILLILYSMETETIHK